MLTAAFCTVSGCLVLEGSAAPFGLLLAAGTADTPNRPVTDWQWSLTRYQNTVSELKGEKEEAAEAWDELEKSVVNRVADDVKISIKGWETEMIILKKMAREAQA